MSERPLMSFQWISDIRNQLQLAQGMIRTVKESYNSTSDDEEKTKATSRHIPRIAARYSPKKGALGFKGSARKRRVGQVRIGVQNLERKEVKSKSSRTKKHSVSKSLLSEMQIRSRESKAQEDWPGHSVKEEEIINIDLGMSRSFHPCTKRLKSAEVSRSKSSETRRRSKSASGIPLFVRLPDPSKDATWSPEASRAIQEEELVVGRGVIQFEPEIAALSVSDDLKWRMLFPHQSIRQNQLVGDMRHRTNLGSPGQIKDSPREGWSKNRELEQNKNAKSKMPCAEFLDWGEKDTTISSEKSPFVLNHERKESYLSKSSMRLCKRIKHLQEIAKQKEGPRERKSSNSPAEPSLVVQNKSFVMIKESKFLADDKTFPKPDVLCPSSGELHNVNPYIRSAARRDLTRYLRSRCEHMREAQQQSQGNGKASRVVLPQLHSQSANALTVKSAPTDAARYAYSRGTLGFPEWNALHKCSNTDRLLQGYGRVTYIPISKKLQ